MIYLIVFFTLMAFIVIKIEKKIISSKYLIKRAHKYRHKTRVERIENRKEINKYKTSLTHKYYLDKNLKDPSLQKMIDKNKYKSLDAFRFEARLFYYGFFISILFGFIFTVTGLYEDEFISSLYPYIEPYFKVFYHNFEKYTFNPLSFKVCFSWVFVFSVFICIFILIYTVIFSSKITRDIEKSTEITKEKIRYLLLFGLSTWILIFYFFQDSSPGDYGERLLYRFPYSYGVYFMYIVACFLGSFTFIITCREIIFSIFRYLKGKVNAN